MLLYKRITAIFIVLANILAYSPLYSDIDPIVEIYENSPLKAVNPRPLNILFVVGHFPSRSQIFILNIMTALIDLGHNVSIFSFNKDDQSFTHSDIEKYRLQDRIIYENFLQAPPECDIVFFQFGYLVKRFFKKVEKADSLKTKKLVVCFRGADITVHLQKDKKMYNRIFKKVDLLLPVCDYFKKKLVALGCPRSKVKVYHSAIDCTRFFFTIKQKPEDGSIQLVSTCRLVPKKGIDVVIKAVADVVKKYPLIHYTIIGDGPEKEYLEGLVVELNLQDKVTFLGWKSQDEVISILDNSHIFLLPSNKAADGNEEGIANALKEAMAMGLITIGSWHAGTPELIDHNVSGFLVLEKSVSGLASIITSIIERPYIWEPIGLAARKKIEQEFEIKRCVKRLEKLFYGLLR